jgi:methylated-DNA-[protein]-cysteine S-methyltransferase
LFKIQIIIYGGSYMSKLHYESPIGVIEIVGTEGDLIPNESQEETPEFLVDCFDQLDQYFKGERHEFTFPYTFEGTDFQKTVWNALTKVPCAKTVSYKDIAVSIGNEKAVRAVGTANGKNKLSIVIPCHRIIGSNGKLTGYAGGLWRKEWLLQHEKTFYKDMSKVEADNLIA